MIKGVCTYTLGRRPYGLFTSFQFLFLSDYFVGLTKAPEKDDPRGNRVVYYVYTIPGVQRTIVCPILLVRLICVTLIMMMKFIPPG
jgi:hypothetical protein